MRFKQSVNIILFTLLLGAGLLSFFVILAGARTSTVLKKFYWLEADTSGFNSAPSTTRWFAYNWCGVEDGNLQGCSSNKPASPFSPRDNFGASDSIPSSFVKHRDTYYYLSRVAWAMLLVGLVYIVAALIPVAITIFSTSVINSWLAVMALWLAAFFVTLAACLYTACYVKARGVFTSNNRNAKLGVKNFAFIWTSVAILMACAIWSSVVAVFFTTKRISRSKGQESGVSSDTYGGDKTTLETRERGTRENAGNQNYRFWRMRVKRRPRDDAFDMQPQVTASEYDSEGFPVTRS
ncbi:LAME_0F16336g1_1 [Lachancea meyersii CBS 8951]|uniref:LAME_0F16336g1_1 n=1 Tax=Lachancea meyersii CBS 8951 TaxID=1266667 RepID=A0A1G4JZ43_9SACH|nr:LAME_0F16336g1_1 [Lachancea meyersii CBS 8951]